MDRQQQDDKIDSKENEIISSNKSPTQVVDLTVFRHEETVSCDDFKQCNIVRKVLTASKYFSVLDIKSNKQHQDIFTNFVNETYKSKSLIEDYMHFQKKHGDQIYEIMTYILDVYKFSPCSIKLCPNSSRLYNHAMKINIPDSKVGVVIDILDSMHFYLFHLFESGFRYNPSHSGNHAAWDESTEEKDEYFDAQLAVMTRTIFSARSVTETFTRLKTGKFNIHINDSPDVNNYDHPSNKNDELGITYLDELCDNLKKMKIQHGLITKLQHYVNHEEFDTESIHMDIKMGSGNLNQFMNNKKCMDVIIEMFDKHKCLSATGAFSIGIYFNYYDDDDPLFVVKKYQHLKEEILHCQHISIEQYKEEIIPKTQIYHETDIVKSMQEQNEWDSKKYHIASGEIISKDRLMCIVLYTDYDSLSTDFSSTFRYSGVFESLHWVKNRHRKYWWMSKLLRETVSVYGQDKEEGMEGPFYCGMSCVMTMPEFNITLLSPTSTSIRMECAMVFSGHNGIIIEFNNDKTYAHIVRGFDVSWISRFGVQEDERLFFGDSNNYNPLNVASIYIQETSTNLKDFIIPISILDSIISNNVNETIKVNNKHCQLLQYLFDYRLSELSEKERVLNKYIYHTFECFVNHKDCININIPELDEYVEDQQLLNLILSDVVKGVSVSSVRYKENTEMSLANTKNNLIQPQILHVFKNVKKIVIETREYGQTYRFSLLYFLAVIKDTQIMEVEIDATPYRAAIKSNWLSNLKHTSLYDELVDAYQKEGFTLEIDDYSYQRGFKTIYWPGATIKKLPIH